MNYLQIVEQIAQKRSFLCVGLDTDYKKLPDCLKNAPEALSVFNKAVIDATAPYTVAYKLNVAFYESEGTAGWNALAETIDYLRASYPEILVIADAKRGDIGNTSEMYARAMFDNLNADAVTVAPYMGEDSIAPFLKHKDKWTIILGLTSNPGSRDFQFQILPDGRPLYQHVLETAAAWGNKENTMFVVGATQAPMLQDIREIVPEHFLLVPGVGAQGGSLEDVALYGMNENCGLLVNSSRGIIYASHDQDFAEAAGQKAAELQQRMAELLEEYTNL